MTIENGQWTMINDSNADSIICNGCGWNPSYLFHDNNKDKLRLGNHKLIRLISTDCSIVEV